MLNLPSTRCLCCIKVILQLDIKSNQSWTSNLWLLEPSAISTCHKRAQRCPPEGASLTSISFNQHQQPRTSSWTNIVPTFFPCAGKKGTTLFSDVTQSRVTNEQTPQSCSRSTDPRYMDPALKALQLTEALKALLEGWGSGREQESVRKQVATDTADVILRWLQTDEVSTAETHSVRCEIFTT